MMEKESPGVSNLSKKKERKMHHVSAMTALKGKEKEFSHAKRAEAAWYSVYASRQE